MLSLSRFEFLNVTFGPFLLSCQPFLHPASFSDQCGQVRPHGWWGWCSEHCWDDRCVVKRGRNMWRGDILRLPSVDSWCMIHSFHATALWVCRFSPGFAVNSAPVRECLMQRWWKESQPANQLPPCFDIEKQSMKTQRSNAVAGLAGLHPIRDEDQSPTLHTLERTCPKVSMNHTWSYLILSLQQSSNWAVRGDST